MTQDPAALYNALASRDPRFDGVFYVGVTSTGIYCRPVCTARTPKAANCRFFESAAAAEQAHFRPCLRCRPELAPGNAPVDDAHRIANLLVHRIEEGMLDGGAGVETIARQFGWSARQIRRMLRAELGVSPMALLLTRRLLLAKQLLTETTLSMTDVAFASGFSSLRRFNDAFGSRYRMPPSRFRREARGTAAQTGAGDTFTVQLVYREPYDWRALLRFLRMRAMRGVESIGEDEYARTVRLGAHIGWVRVRHAPRRRALLVEVAHSLTPALPALLTRLRQLFDLGARPDVIATRLAGDDLLARAVARNPGLRVPGAFDGFELATRAILGQQITVQAATTLAGRFAETFGEPISTAHPALTRLTPTPERVAVATNEEIASLGIIGMRARSIIALAAALMSRELDLSAGAPPETTIERLLAVPGIGPWTAHYIAMRALHWPDAFPKEDVALRRALGGVSPARAEVLSRTWRPWRSYAAVHVWEGGLRPDGNRNARGRNEAHPRTPGETDAFRASAERTAVRT